MRYVPALNVLPLVRESIDGHDRILHKLTADGTEKLIWNCEVVIHGRRCSLFYSCQYNNAWFPSAWFWKRPCNFSSIIEKCAQRVAEALHPCNPVRECDQLLLRRCSLIVIVERRRPLSSNCKTLSFLLELLLIALIKDL